MINLIITFNKLPTMNPTKAPKAVFNARGMVFPLMSSPIKAPDNDPIIIPQGPIIKIPIINLIKTP